MNWLLTALYIYLATGVVVLGVLMLRGKLKRRGNAATNPYGSSKSKGWKALIENLVLAPLALTIFFVPAWPLVLFVELSLPVHKLKFWKRGADSNTLSAITSEPEPVFSVRRENLVKRLTIKQIESAEVVYDPMQAVPPVPFGHLNQVWESFKEKLGTAPEVWSFSRQWITPYRNELVQGYVEVSNGSIVQHVVTASKWLDK